MERLIQSVALARSVGHVAMFVIVVMPISLGLATANAFELLSEGAMDSVSAVSAQSVEDLISIAGSPAAGLSDDYESLPFQTRLKVVEGNTDKVQTELDFELTKEVEAWAGVLREQGERQIEIGFVDELQPSSLDVNPFVFQNEQALDFTPDEDGEGDEERTTLRQGRITRSVELLEPGVESITYRYERIIEDAATINANPLNDNTSIGSGYISEVHGTSTQVYSNYRDADKPLF